MVSVYFMLGSGDAGAAGPPYVAQSCLVCTRLYHFYRQSRCVFFDIVAEQRFEKKEKSDE